MNDPRIGELWQGKLTGKYFAITHVDADSVRFTAFRPDGSLIGHNYPATLRSWTKGTTLVHSSGAACDHQWNFGPAPLSFFCMNPYCTVEYKIGTTLTIGNVVGTGSSLVYPATKAPCVHVWVESPGFSRMYIDCSKCNQKYEDYLSQGGIPYEFKRGKQA